MKTREQYLNASQEQQERVRAETAKLDKLLAEFYNKPSEAPRFRKRGLERFQRTEPERVKGKNRFYGAVALFAAMKTAAESEHWRKMVEARKAEVLAVLLSAMESLNPEPLRECAKAISTYLRSHARSTAEKGQGPRDPKDYAILNTYRYEPAMSKAQHYRLVKARIRISNREFLRRVDRLGLCYVRGKPGRPKH